MSIAVPDRCILAESDQLIKYSSPSNSQTEALKQKANTLGLSVMQQIGWPFLVGVACQTKNEKNVHFAGLAPPTSAWWSSLDVHSLQTASMYTKKPKEMGSQSMICWLLCCLKGHAIETGRMTYKIILYTESMGGLFVLDIILFLL